MEVQVDEFIHCILMDFPIQVNTMRMRLSVIYLKGSQVKLSKIINYELQSLKILFILANSEDSDEMPRIAAFHLGPHCLQKYPRIQWVESQFKKYD